MRIPQIFTLIRDLHPLANTHAEHTNKGDKQFSLLVAFCRNEATRTPDPYVPNVVRYQLRYIPNADAKVNEKTDNRAKNHEKIACATQNEYLCKPIQRYSY